MSNLGVRQRRAVLFKEQDGKCHYCKVEMRKSQGSHNSITLDEIIPRAHGGQRTKKNTIGACWACNNARGVTPYDQFKIHVETNGRPSNTPRPNPKEWVEGRKEKERKRAVKKQIVYSLCPWSRKMPKGNGYNVAARFPILADAFGALKDGESSDD